MARGLQAKIQRWLKPHNKYSEDDISELRWLIGRYKTQWEEEREENRKFAEYFQYKENLLNEIYGDLDYLQAILDSYAGGRLPDTNL